MSRFQDLKSNSGLSAPAAWSQYIRGPCGAGRSPVPDPRRSATPSYLRPPGGTAFISGAAITWSTAAGKRVTAFRLAWVGTDITDNASIGNSTVYGFVHDVFDLTRLDGLKPARSGTAPLSEASMRHLIDGVRGDLIDHRQTRMQRTCGHDRLRRRR